METMFGILRKKTKRNNMDDRIRDKISQVYLDPNYIVERLSSILAKETNGTSGHIHFYFRTKSDHIILIWSEGKLRKIIAKSLSCEKDQYVHWTDSEFCNYEREDILRRFHNEIERVEIDVAGFRKMWPSCPKFMKWSVENE